MIPGIPGTITATCRAVRRSGRDATLRAPLPAPQVPTFLCFSCGKVWALPDWNIDQLSYSQEACPHCGKHHSHPEYGWGRHILQALVKYRRFAEGSRPEVFISNVVWIMEARPGMDDMKVPVTTEIDPVTEVTRQVKRLETNTFRLWGNLKELELWCQRCQASGTLSRAAVFKLYKNRAEPVCRTCGGIGKERAAAREGLAAMIRLAYYAERAAWSGFILGPPVWLESEPPGWDVLPKTEEEIRQALIPYRRVLAAMRGRQ